MNANDIDLITLRKEIRATRRDMFTERTRSRGVVGQPYFIETPEYTAAVRRFNRLQAVHVQKTGGTYA